MIDTSEESKEERYYKDQLRKLQESYHKAAEPIIKRLVYLRSIRQTEYIIDISAAHEIGMIPQQD